jgi:formyltetrahydrofolate deformylase
VIKTYILTLSCVDRPGIVAAVASQITAAGGNIAEAQQFDDHETGRFFMRVLFECAAPLNDIKVPFSKVADRFRMEWHLDDASRKAKVLLLVSSYDHCLVDLLYRTRLGELSMEVVGIVSNHPRSRFGFLSTEDIPFHYLPITSGDKSAQEAQVRKLVESTGTDLVVLARYMQILSDEMCKYLNGFCINIHHSFLPSFKGAKPYHQAHARGVKLIGATAHYVTSDLDEGPIIIQDVEQITHGDTPEDLVRKGRGIEQRVLARAVSYHLQRRVFINGAKTIVFRD